MKYLYQIFLLLYVSHLSAQEELPCQKSHNHLPLSKYEIRNPKTETYDLSHYAFYLQIDPAKYYINSHVDITLTPTTDITQIVFDFSNLLTVDSVFVNGIQNYDFAFTSEFELTLTLNQQQHKGNLVTLKIYYHGEPASGGFGSFIQSQHNGTPIIWTLSEPYGARDWWPCKNGLTDKLDSLDMYITTSKKYKAASNGILMEEAAIDDSTKIYHWKHKYSIAPYLVAFAVTNYEAYSDIVPLNDGTPLQMLNYVYPENLTNAKIGTQKLIQVLQFYDSLFYNYPFKNEKYGHAQFGWGGGMEHQTMSFVTSYGWLLLSHELAHQWFGDMVTCGSWEDIWLNEGFATYLEGLSRERFPLQADYNFTKWKQDKINHITNSSGGSVFVNDTMSVDRIFNGRLTYSKGAYLLHMLRWKLGDDSFFQGIRNYLEAMKYKYATTNDLKYYLEQISNYDLTEYFEDWFYGEGYPSYNITWNNANDNSIILKIYQQSSHPSVSFFDMPLEILVMGEGKNKLIRVDHQENGQIFLENIGFKVDSIIFDPNLWIISKDNIVIRSEELNSQDDVTSSTLIYPNPVIDYIRLSPEIQPKQISIYDTQGKLITELDSLNSKPFIDFSNYVKGVYIVIINSGHFHKQIKVVKL